MLQFIENLFTDDTLPWLLFVLSFGALLLLFFVFLIHRKNNKAQISQLEERMHEFDTQTFSRTLEELDQFKKALMLHLAEIGERIKDNETLSNRLVNMVDALREAIDELNNETKKQ